MTESECLYLNPGLCRDWGKGEEPSHMFLQELDEDLKY